LNIDLFFCTLTTADNPTTDQKDASMTTEAFRKLLKRQPFQPFRLVMSSGKSYDVRHPEMALVLRNDILVGVDVADDGLPADFDICPLFHVATVEALAGPPNG
jgi:hypothetical protein